MSTRDRAIENSGDLGLPSLTSDEWVRCPCNGCHLAETDRARGRTDADPIYVRRRLRKLPEHMTREQQFDFAVVLMNAMASALEAEDAATQHTQRRLSVALANAAKPARPSRTEADLRAEIESLRKRLSAANSRAGQLEKRLSFYVPDDTSIAADAVIGAVVRRALRGLKLPNTEGIEDWRPSADEARVACTSGRPELQRRKE